MLIELLNASKFYKVNGEKKYILKNTTLQIPTEKNIAILGKNGAGKSTLLKILGGIDHPSSGSVFSDKTFSWPMGVSGGLQGSMTARQNVRFVCMIYGKDGDEITNVIESVLEFTELGAYFDMPIKTYSSGMRARLNLGVSLAFDFDYFLIDEVLSVGDTTFKQKSKQAIEDKIQHKRIIMVSHATDTLREFCSASIVLNAGSLTYYDNVEDGIAQYNTLI